MRTLATDLVLEGTTTTPFVQFQPVKGTLDFKGRSSPRETVKFYQSIISVVDEYLSEGEQLTASFSFEYFNTSSSKCIFDMMKCLKKASSIGKQVIINWYYEEWDDDMKETGEDYADAIGLPFNFIPVN
ncbi:MAG: DUF1987 domain-containing protein [Cyclobacteriaceae bacterium]|nr:DUF1987 domain-containing protein [Cyclobacteriaceae bacterium HetDA_MAG_MS6]